MSKFAVNSHALRVVGVCMVLAHGALFLPTAWAQAGDSIQLLKSEAEAVKQLKVDDATRGKVMTAIQEMDKKFAAWDAKNGAELKKFIAQAKTDSVTDPVRAKALIGELNALNDELRKKIGKELSLSQILEYGSQLEEIQKKEQEKNKSGRGMVGVGSGMKATPRRAVESLGLSEEKLAPLLELVKEYEAKSLEESKKRSALITEAGKLNKSESAADRAQGAELLKKVAQIKMPSAAELDAKILAGLSVEQQAKYKELRKIDDAGKMTQTTAATGGKAPIAEKPVEKSTEKGIEKPAWGKKAFFEIMDAQEFRDMSHVVFSLPGRASNKPEGPQRQNELVKGLAYLASSSDYTKEDRMALIEVPKGVELVSRAQVPLSGQQYKQMVDEIKATEAKVDEATTEKEKRVAFARGFSKIVGVLTEQQKVWVVMEGNK